MNYKNTSLLYCEKAFYMVKINLCDILWENIYLHGFSKSWYLPRLSSPPFMVSNCYCLHKCPPGSRPFPGKDESSPKPHTLILKIYFINILSLCTDHRSSFLPTGFQTVTVLYAFLISRMLHVMPESSSST